MKNKIISLSDLIKIKKKSLLNNNKIVLCHGVFDVLHIGHLKHFKEAKQFGDILIVTLTPDRFVNKGPDRPMFSERNRLEAVSSIEVIDYVTLNDQPTSLNVIRNLKPNFYCKGSDYKNHKSDLTGAIKKETALVKKYNGKIIFTKSELFSSSEIINKIRMSKTKNENLLINKIKKEYDIKKISNLINDFKKLKILVIGELIIDEYNFCEALGKSGKEPMLVLKDVKKEEYIGGSGAICNHLKSFSQNISLISVIGEKGEKLSTLKKSLNFCKKINLIKKKNSPTIIKKRFLDSINLNKVLGVYSINDDMLEKNNEDELKNILKKELSKYDLVIVSDYGHGFISKQSAKIICKYSKFLALNSQINAANIGYHNISNYNNIEFFIVNEKEIRHELRDKNRNIEFLIKKISNEKNIKYLVVTRGKSGCILYIKKQDKFIYSSAYANNVIDKIGSGDAMLAIIALCLKSGVSPELSLIIGSLVAAQSVETIGSKTNISKLKILRFLEFMLK